MGVFILHDGLQSNWEMYPHVSLSHSLSGRGFTRWTCHAHPTHPSEPYPGVVAVVEKEANAGSYFGLNVLLAAVVR